MSIFEDAYQTIQKNSEGIFRDKGSKFIAYAFPFSDETLLKEIIGNLKSIHPKARHYCWAYRLTVDGAVYRVNDDGEPSGTAGRPILNALISNGLTNILVVVVRYFGGTLLGVPGLIHAYKAATLEAIAGAVIIEKTVNDVYAVEFEYLQLNDVMKVIKEENLTILGQQFDNNCVVTLEVRQMQLNTVLGKLNHIEGITTKYLRTI